MKTFCVMVSGCQRMLVDAPSEDEATQKASDYLSDHSLLRDWEIGWAEELTEYDDPSDYDIKIAQGEVIVNG